jgi:hypothetical protein
MSPFVFGESQDLAQLLIDRNLSWHISCDMVASKQEDATVLEAG